MSRGLDITLHVFATTRNEAAASVLVPALNADDENIQLGALQSLLERRSPSGHRALVARWHCMPPTWKEFILPKRGQLTGAIRDAVLSSDEQLSTNGCNAALAMAEYDLIPTLIQVAEADAAARGDLAAHTLRELADRLYAELAAPRDWRRRREPQLLRAHVVSALELSVARFGKHGRREIVEAFLMLTARDNATLRRVLLDPLDVSHVPVVELMTYSPRPSIARLTLSFLDDARAPGAALQVLAHRDDEEFLQLLMQKIGRQPNSGTRINLRKIKNIVWLEQNHTRLLSLNEDGQHAAAKAAICSGLERDAKLNVLKLLITHGEPAGRRAAAAALAEFHGVDANRLVLEALRDDDPHVQASALSQLRERGLPGAMATLIESLDHPAEIVRETARGCLREFNFSRFVSAFDGLADDVRRNTGQLVKKVDLSTRQLMAEEMTSPSRNRRLRAIEMASVLDMVGDLEPQLHELLYDDDHVVRVEAATILAECPTEKTRLALRDAMLDRSVAVQNAASRALEAMTTTRPRQREKIDAAALATGEAGLASMPGGAQWF